MLQDPLIKDKPFNILQEIDLVALRPGDANNHTEMLDDTRLSITEVLRDFLAVMDITDDRLSLIDGFLYLFNEQGFPEWHRLNWWDQRKRILAVKEHHSYTGRANVLLKQSCLAPYIDYTDKMVANSTDQAVKKAWMRKRLVLKECFWNAIDSFSHAAYFQKKYQQMFPALCVLLCNIIDKNGRETELLLGIDNGTGFLYKKKSRESALIRFIYKTYKLFARNGVFYIGGLELGLLETESELSCHGTGAVVYQGWNDKKTPAG